jgi:GT2 family glycosyltransferase
LLESALPYQWSLSLVTERPTALSEVEAISGASLVIPRDLFRRLGGFDERFFMYYEDFDLCMRARGSGVPIFQEPRAVAVHHARQSTAGNRELFFWYVYRSKLMIVQKHGSPAAALLAFTIMLLGLAARIPAYAVAGKLLRDPELLHLSKCHTFVLSRFPAFYFSTQHA